MGVKPMKISEIKKKTANVIFAPVVLAVFLMSSVVFAGPATIEAPRKVLDFKKGIEGTKNPYLLQEVTNAAIEARRTGKPEKFNTLIEKVYYPADPVTIGGQEVSSDLMMSLEEVAKFSSSNYSGGVIPKEYYKRALFEQLNGYGISSSSPLSQGIESLSEEE